MSELPLNEIVLDFYDCLKSVSRWLRITRLPPCRHLGLAHGQDGHPRQRRTRRRAVHYRPPRLRLRPGQALVSRLRELIPRQMFEVALQAAIGSKVVSRETVTAIRKNVMAKCYGGDISRKRKLLEKQKEGKKA